MLSPLSGLLHLRGELRPGVFVPENALFFHGSYAESRKEPGAPSSGFVWCYDQAGRPDGWRAFSSVATKYSSRSRSNFCCVALKFATRAAISSRSLAILSCCSVMPSLFESCPALIGGRDWGANWGTALQDCGC